MTKSLAVSIAILFIPVFLLSCSAQAQDSSPRMAQLPEYTIDATVITLFLDPNNECLEKCPGYQYPKDRGIIRINKIKSVENPDRVGGEGFAENSEIEVEFLYSSRPARIIYLHSNSVNDASSEGTAVSDSPSLAQPIPVENDYFIYTVETFKSGQPELVLPGLHPGEEIQALVFLETPSKGLITEYKIIE